MPKGPITVTVGIAEIAAGLRDRIAAADVILQARYLELVNADSLRSWENAEIAVIETARRALRGEA